MLEKHKKDNIEKKNARALCDYKSRDYDKYEEAESKSLSSRGPPQLVQGVFGLTNVRIEDAKTGKIFYE